MLLLLIRHAQAAEPDDARFPDDQLRPLVPKGRKTQRRMCRLLRKQGGVPDRVYSSPWKRAWQTARIVVEETGIGRQRRLPCQPLAAPPDLPALVSEIGDFGADERIGLVGHEPWMSDLASLLIAGTAGGAHIDFPKSGIMGIETERLEAGAGVLVFFLRP
jgi:phosphohistidine phosphatase